MKNGFKNARKKVACEAANLLYSGIEKEYKQAKLKAAKTFGVNFLPTNLEVALELDKMAEEKEGKARQERLIYMRKDALKLMKILKEYSPLLIGSVWRGTIDCESDIDIVVRHDDPGSIINILKQNSVKIAQAEWVSVTKKGKEKRSFHILVECPAKEKAEIKVISPEEANRKEKCEIYGDEITGLHIKELEMLLRRNASQRFVPF
ncbi:MAG: hypothetical protein OEY22_06520 [Candidatus Bathyarchaeota archaeon]|nr:hypothetical protein [Candidatus Bathyarchaeota archaeon]MDH5787398.1 hypothetical protein [Candidatus Bathyarchaeota archaeon]